VPPPALAWVRARLGEVWPELQIVEQLKPVLATASKSGTAASLFKVCLVGVALGAEVEASVSDVLAAQDKRTAICPERR